MLRLQIAQNPFSHTTRVDPSQSSSFEESGNQTILTGEAFAHEGRALLLARMVLSPEDLGYQAMRHAMANCASAGVSLPYRGTYFHWANNKLLPAGLVEQKTPETFRASKQGLEALPLAGAFFELSERFDRSLLAATGKSQGKSPTVFTRRISSIRAAHQALVSTNGEIHLENLRERLKLTTENEALAYMKRVAQTALFTVEASTIATHSYYEQDTNIDTPLAKHASQLQQLYVATIQREGGVDIEYLFSVGVLEGLLKDTEADKNRARLILQGMERRGQVVRTVGRFVDGYVCLKADQRQMEYMSDILEVLDRFTARDAVFMRLYGRYALDVVNDKQIAGRILRRALRTTGRQRTPEDLDTDNCVIHVLQTYGGPLCITDITEEIARQFAAGAIPKPLSVITVRKILKRLTEQSRVDVHGGKSNAKFYSMPKQ